MTFPNFYYLVTRTSSKNIVICLSQELAFEAAMQPENSVVQIVEGEAPAQLVLTGSIVTVEAIEFHA